MAVRDFKEEHERLKALVEEALLGFLPKEDPKARRLFQSMRYSLEAGGKRIRPVLLLGACLAAGGREEDGLAFACALECIHTYSLIHDDLPSMDDDDLRRGKPTNHKVFGEATAILAGDGLLNGAYEGMLGDIQKSRAEQLLRKVKAAGIIARAAGAEGMVGGQMADIQAEKSLALSEEQGEKQDPLALADYIHRHKTGALIQASLVAGGVLGGGEEDFLKALSDFGEKIGLAFQIADDILDICGETQILGKPVKSDQEKDKLTYPAILGLQEAKNILEKLHDQGRQALCGYESRCGFLLWEAQALAKRTF